MKVRLFFSVLVVLSIIIYSRSIYAQEPNSKNFYYPTGSINYRVSTRWLASNCDGKDKYITLEGDPKYHLGTDIVPNDKNKVDGSPVYAISDGEVVYRSDKKTSGWGDGNIGLVVKHKLSNGQPFFAVYGHIRSGLNEGDDVYAGKSFATIGPFFDKETGSAIHHLHFGINLGHINPSTGELVEPRTNLGLISCKYWPNKNNFKNPIEWIEKQKAPSTVHTLDKQEKQEINAKRIIPLRQSSVYTTKNSRTYHKHNCSELNVNDLIEFKSSQEADSAGAIPCKHFNQPDSAKHDHEALPEAGSKPDITVQKTEKFSYTISLKPSLTYELFVPIMRRSAKDHSSRIFGVFNKRDMWYNVKIFERSHGQHSWEMVSTEAIILKPTTDGEITKTFNIAEGKDFKFEVSNDLNDPRLLALWCTDFISRAIVGRSMSWDDPAAAKEAIAFFTNFLSPNLQALGIGLGLGGDFISDPKRTVQRIAKAILASKPSQAALAKVMAAGGVPIATASLASLTAIILGNAAINAPAWWELFQNINLEPQIEEVIFQTSSKLVMDGIDDDLAISRQVYEEVGVRWIYKLTVYDERNKRLSHGRLVAINDGVVGFGGVQAIQFSRRLELDSPISGWEGYYRDPISDGGSYYSLLEDRVLALGGWTTGRVTTRWMLDPPGTIGSMAPDKEYRYEGAIEYFDGVRKRHAPTTIKVQGREIVEVPAGTYSAIRISSTSVDVLHYNSIFCDVWRLPKTGAVKIMERSPSNYWWEAELIEFDFGK